MSIRRTLTPMYRPFRSWLGVCLLGAMIINPMMVLAQEPATCNGDGPYMTPEQKKIFQKGISDFDICPINPPADTGTSGSTDGPLSGCGNVEQTWNFLKGKGLGDAQVAGIMGNLRVESGDSINPNAKNSAGYTGIAQWSTGRFGTLQNWVKANPGPNNNTDPYDLGNQLRYLWYEATTTHNPDDPFGGSIVDGIKHYNDPEHTTWYWGRFFEIAIIGGSRSTTPLTNVQALPERTRRARSTLTTASSGNWCPNNGGSHAQ